MIVSEVQNDVDLCVTSELNHPEYNPRPQSPLLAFLLSRIIGYRVPSTTLQLKETRTNDDATNLQGGGFTFSVYM